VGRERDCGLDPDMSVPAACAGRPSRLPSKRTGCPPEQSAFVRDGVDVDAPSFDPAMAARNQS
jgi:hypothetical protein